MMKVKSSLRPYGMRSRYEGVSVGRAKRIMKNTAKRKGLIFNRDEMEVCCDSFDMFYIKHKKVLCLIEEY